VAQIEREYRAKLAEKQAGGRLGMSGHGLASLRLQKDDESRERRRVESDLTKTKPISAAGTMRYLPVCESAGARSLHLGVDDLARGRGSHAGDQAGAARKK
jgi:hypothetical protein